MSIFAKHKTRQYKIISAIGWSVSFLLYLKETILVCKANVYTRKIKDSFWLL